MKPRLIGRGGEFELKAEGLTIGRDPSNTIPIGDDSVSSLHCRIEGDDGHFAVVDCNSKNGTHVNGRQVARAILENGDTIRVGGTSFRFLTTEEFEPASSGSILLDAFEDEGVLKTLILDPSDSVFLNTHRAPRSKLDQLNQDMGVLMKFGAEINEVDNAGELDRLVLKRLFEITPADSGAIIPASTRNELILSAAVSHQGLGQGGDIPVSTTITREVLESGQAMIRNRLLGDNSAPESVIEAKIRSVLCVPLVVRGSKLGVIYLNTATSKQEFEQRHLEIVTAIAGMTAVALEHLRYVKWLEDQNEQLQHEVAIRHDMIGNSAKMKDIYERISRVALGNSRVLILGESGTGKELAARAIHNNSARRTGPFVVVNCAAIPEQLFEAEMYGHTKNAFTGAERERKGYIEEADGGTLFLDEIGDLAAPLQSKLLRVIEDSRVTRVGSTQAKVVDIRLISATSRPLTTDIAAGAFRNDLFHRLGLRLEMPALRERLEDLPALVRFFVEKYERLAQRELGLTPPETIRALQEYHWPGNVRELGASIEWAVVFGKSDRIRPEDLPPNVLKRSVPIGNAPRKLDDAKDAYEKQLILRALEDSRGVVTEAAALLDRVPTYLQRRISQLGLRKELKRIRG